MIVRLWNSFLQFFGLRREMLTSEELQSRIANDVTDKDVDKFLPKSLRKYESQDSEGSR